MDSKIIALTTPVEFTTVSYFFLAVSLDILFPKFNGFFSADYFVFLFSIVLFGSNSSASRLLIKVVNNT